MSKPLTPGQEIAVLTSALGSTIRERNAAESLLDDWQKQQSLIEADKKLIETLRAENERLTNALNMLRTSITQAPGIQSQEDNWMLGIIDTALGDGPAADRPHPLAPVEVQ